MSLLFQSLTFGAAVFLMIVGLVGILIPIVPGMILIWLTVLFYAVVERSNGFAAIDPLSFIVLTLIAVVGGLADLWLPLLGARVTGSSRRSVLFGFLGGIIGTFFFPLLGTIAGYAAGVLLGEYHKRRDWDQALRAGFKGLAGWGIATAVQLGGGLIILLIFIWQVLEHRAVP